MERHPVWFGAIVGFGIGFALPFMSEGNGIVGPTGPGLVFGGMGAGLGALAGWGVSRANDESNSRLPTPNSQSGSR